MNILIIEDEEVQLMSLRMIIERKYFDIKVFAKNSLKDSRKIIEEKNIDMFFIDIQLKDGSGLDFAKELRKMQIYKLTPIVFITNQATHIIDAFKKIHCYDFLLKPFKLEEIYKIINVFNKDYSYKELNKSEYIIIGLEDNIQMKIYYKDIIFLEYKNRTVFINTVNGCFVSKKYTLEKLLKEIKCSNILRTHKSYIININYVKQIKKIYRKLWEVEFINTEEIAELTLNYKEDFSKVWGEI